jgi:hypothetical protein
MKNLVSIPGFALLKGRHWKISVKIKLCKVLEEAKSKICGCYITDDVEEEDKEDNNNNMVIIIIMG